MASAAVISQTSENKDGGNKRTPCPLHGCKRVYTDVNALELHIKEHELPAQSLPGKVLLCSTGGCSGSFSNMQKLMEHMRHHHKHNTFFMCESCRTKLRSYRGLLTHLHTCSKVSRGKSKPMEAAPPQPAAVTNTNMAAVDQKPPSQDSESRPQQLAPQIPTQSFPAAVPQPESSAVPLLGPPYLSHSESFSYPELTQPLPQPPPLTMENLSAAPEPSDALGQKNQTQSRCPESTHPAPGFTSHSPPSLSSAVWKKNQGMASNRRILWEHSKGRYTCVQCGNTATNRKEMTQHINTQHSGGSVADASGISATHA